MRRGAVLGVVIGVWAVLAVGCGADPRVTGVVALTGDATAGADLFDKQGCKDCHGAKATGGFPGPDLSTAEVKSAEPEQIANTILSGAFLMPAFGDKLKDQEVADIMAFIQGLP